MAKEQAGVLSGHNPSTYDGTDPITLFIIQVIIIIVFTRIIYLVLSRFRQPRVISEVLGGILLGPSVIGLAPNYKDTIFPKESIPILNLVATLGLVLFLFIVGVELNPSLLLKNSKIAFSISAAGIIIPFVLGAGVSYGMFNAIPQSPNVPFSSFALFLGVAMSITAFPVLARILSELQLLKTPVGSMALSAGVGDDVAAWILLALVVSIINSTSAINTLYIILLAVAWVLLVIFVVRPIILYLVVKTGSDENGPTLSMMAITLAIVLISSFVTNIIGIHAIFGAFIIGVIIPHDRGFALGITEKIEDLVTVLLLPIYFTLSGLKTTINKLDDGTSWGYVFLIIFIAMFGKIVGCTLVARLYKFVWRESLTIGVFMSCKGLVELIVLNIGHDAGIIDDKVFSIMVIMALITTVMTTPLALWLYPHDYQRTMELKRQREDPNHITENIGGGETDSHTRNDKLMIVLNQVEYLPAMMTLVQLLQPLPHHSNGNEPSDKVPKALQPLIVHVLRLVPLTQRISAVMKFNETEETTLHDPIMNVFRTFGQFNHLKVQANLAVVAKQDFCQQVAEHAEDTDSNWAIIPWGGAGAIIDDPENALEEVLGPRQNNETSPQVSQFIQGIFNKTTKANIGVLVDRGLRVNISNKGNSEKSTSLHIFIPFYGGADDREALSFVLRLLEHPHVNVNVLRIKVPPELNDEKHTPSLHELEEANPNHTVSTTSSNVLNTATAQQASVTEDDLLLKKMQSVKNERLNFNEMDSTTPLKTAIEYARSIIGRNDLVILGRGRRSALINHRKEYFDLTKLTGGYDNEARKSLGESAVAYLSEGIPSSVLVIQAGSSKKISESQVSDISAKN